MPSNEIKLNGSPELTWNVSDSRMPELLRTLAKLGSPNTVAAKKQQHVDNPGYIEVLLAEEEWPVFGRHKVSPIVALRDAYGMTFYIIEDDHCYVVLKDNKDRRQDSAQWLPDEVARALANLSLEAHTRLR